MPDNTPSQIDELPADIAVPRDNGELQFAQPWEARAFGMAVLLNENGSYPWKHFSERLAETIHTAESHGDESAYYERWLNALESLAIENGLVSRDELTQRAIEQAHQHNHDHDHDHDH